MITERFAFRASVEKNALMSRFFGRFWQNLRLRETLKKAAPRVAAYIKN